MPIADFPAALQPIIQIGYLEHQFRKGLQATLAFRRCADRMEVPIGIGETYTATREGLLPSITTPINAAATLANTVTTTSAYPNLQTAARLDNGLIPQTGSVEQYTVGIDRYAATKDLNTRTSRVAIASQFTLNAYTLGEQASRSLDDIARNNLYATYAGGNTFVRTAATTTSVPIDDVRGFLQVPVGGKLQTVSGTYTSAVTIGAGAYTVVGVTTDVSNVSTAFGGTSGVLTLSAAVSTGDGAQYNPVVVGTAPTVTRPNAKVTTQALTTTDRLTMATLLDAVATLRSNNVPTIDGLYDAMVGPKSMRQLFADADFKQLFQGAMTEQQVIAAGRVEQPFLGLRFMMNTQVPVAAHPTIAGLRVERPIVIGQGALIEGDFAGEYNPDDGGTPNRDIETVEDGIRMVTRPPVDRLNSVITQSWEWIGGFCSPTDVTTNSTTVGSATNAAYKRAVMIEHVS